MSTEGFMGQALRRAAVERTEGRTRQTAPLHADSWKSPPLPGLFGRRPGGEGPLRRADTEDAPPLPRSLRGRGTGGGELVALTHCVFQYHGNSR